MSNLEANDGAAWIKQNAEDTAAGVCKSNWRQCQAYVARPGDFWDLNNSNDTAMYEAYRAVYRHLLAQIRSGAASVSAGYFGGGYGGRVVLGDDSASIDIVSADWAHGSSAVTSSWRKQDSSLSWDDVKILGAGALWLGCTAATSGAGAAACTAGTVALWAAGEAESVIDRGLLPGGKKADWAGFAGDSAVNTITAVIGYSASGSAYSSYLAAVGASASEASPAIMRLLNGVGNSPGFFVTVGNP
jgi:hypothetical protein